MRGFTDETAPHQIVLEAYGVALRVCASASDTLASIEPYLPPGWRAVNDAGAHRMGLVSEDDGSFTVYDDASPINTGGDLPLSLVVLDTQMRVHIAIHAPGRVFIHAAVVSYGGRAIVMPGHSTAGKTTLATALVRAGARYYSDEFAVLDHDGLVHAYPRRPSPKRPGGLLPLEDEIDRRRGLARVPPIPLGLAVFTHYAEGARWNPKRLPAGQAALRMIENAIPARNRPEETVIAITNALRGAVALEGERGEAAEVAEALLRLIALVAPP